MPEQKDSGQPCAKRNSQPIFLPNDITWSDTIHYNLFRFNGKRSETNKPIRCKATQCYALSTKFVISGGIEYSHCCCRIRKFALRLTTKVNQAASDLRIHAYACMTNPSRLNKRQRGPYVSASKAAKRTRTSLSKSASKAATKKVRFGLISRPTRTKTRESALAFSLWRSRPYRL